MAVGTKGNNKESPLRTGRMTKWSCGLSGVQDYHGNRRGPCRLWLAPGSVFVSCEPAVHTDRLCAPGRLNIHPCLSSTATSAISSCLDLRQVGSAAGCHPLRACALSIANLAPRLRGLLVQCQQGLRRHARQSRRRLPRCAPLGHLAASRRGLCCPQGGQTQVGAEQMVSAFWLSAVDVELQVLFHQWDR